MSRPGGEALSAPERGRFGRLPAYVCAGSSSINVEMAGKDGLLTG